MSATTTAGLFHDIMRDLSETPDKRTKKIARRIYEKVKDYDFAVSEMYADEFLIKLDLARHGLDEEGFEIVEYYLEDY